MAVSTAFNMGYLSDTTPSKARDIDVALKNAIIPPNITPNKLDINVITGPIINPYTSWKMNPPASTRRDGGTSIDVKRVSMRMYSPKARPSLLYVQLRRLFADFLTWCDWKKIASQITATRQAKTTNEEIFLAFFRLMKAAAFILMVGRLPMEYYGSC